MKDDDLLYKKIIDKNSEYLYLKKANLKPNKETKPSKH